MKKYLLLISLLFVTINVDASNGICDGRPSAANGYCLLETPLTDNPTETTGYVFTDGYTTTSWHHKTTIEGTEVDLYCIDPNRNTPKTLYYGKELSVDNGGYDAGLIKMHQIYLAEKNSVDYIDINTAVRFFNAGLGYGKSGGAEWESIEKYINGANAFEGLEPKYPKFPTLKTDQNYQASQAIYCAGKLAGGSSAFCRTFLSGYGGIYTAETKDYNIEFVVDGTPEDVPGSSYGYHKKVKVKVEGIEDIKNAISSYGLAYLNPEITFEKVSCSKGECKANISEGTDLLNGDDTFELEVYGSYEEIASNPKITVEIDYKYFFPFGASGVGLLVESPNESNQRMVGYLDSMHHKLTFDLDITLPNVCKYENGQLKLGNKNATIEEYINAGCCEGLENFNLSKSQEEIYNEQCKDQDHVNLIMDCQGECASDGSTVNQMPSDSSVEQVNRDGLLSKLKKYEDKVMNNQATLDSFQNYTKNAMQYWRDKTFNNNNNIETNEYCKLYTTENNHMIYPMTTASTSGRFFVFTKDSDGQYSQPEVKGEITAFFYTAYDVWQRDYLAAVRDEKAKFDAWQKEANLQDAIDDSASHPMNSSCWYCSGGRDPEDNHCLGWSQEKYITYTGRTQDDYYYGVYNSGVRGKETVSWTTSQICAVSPKPSTNVVGAHNAYVKAYEKRQGLEEKKTSCQKANSNFKNSWKYILDPDLSFTYTQQYYDSVSGNTKVVEQEVEFVKSVESDGKYWTHVSTLPNTSGATTNSTNVNYKDTSGKHEGPLYGKLGANDYSKGYNTAYENVEETDRGEADSEKTGKADLYYKPTVGYYSLVPSGLYITDQQSYSYPDVLEIGYVFNVQITNYQGKYRTWFTIENNGHLEIEPKGKSKNESNVQYRINQKLAEGNVFESLCVYCNREVLYDRDCPTCCFGAECCQGPDCDGRESEDFYPEYIYRTINPSNMDPNNRKDSGDLGDNWSNAKGEAAESRIKQIGLKDGMFDDTPDSETLEYVFNLDTKTMQEIKKYNKNSNYYDWSSGYSGGLFSCNSDGKECISSFVTRYASNTSGRQKYKYYFASDNQFKVGTMRQLLPDGYPDVNIDDDSIIYP
ncbi:MAG: hypothetical protein Q4C44_00955 [bacterium]|nr:hypothetical protein [bacterium]